MCSNLKLSAYKIMRKNYSNLFFAAVLFLTGCSMTFPLPDEKNQTMLIIPVETRQTLRHFVFTLDLSIKDSANNKIVHHQIEPNPKMLFSYNTQLKPGKYKITEMIRKAKPGFKLGGKKKRRHEMVKGISEFQLEKGKITIIDKSFLFQQPKPTKKGMQSKGMGMKGKVDAAERVQEQLKRKAERKTEQKEMREQRVRFVQIVDLDESFKTKLMEELKEVENFEKWK